MATTRKTLVFSEKPVSDGDELQTPNALEIFCRLRPSTTEDDKDNALIKRQSDTVLSLRRPHSPTEQQFTFEHIFDADCSQRLLFNRVAAPKIATLISGEGDGLIFAYGTTGSGKSFTIGGLPEKPGLVPSTIASLFGQLAGRLSTASIVADGLNYYTIDSSGMSTIGDDQNEEDAAGKDIVEKWLSAASNFENDDAKAVSSKIQRGRRYAVFISFVEIYNNYIYDLLQKGPSGDHQPAASDVADWRRRPALPLRLDVGRSTLATHKSTNFSVYVHGARELRAKTARQAMQLFLQGLQNRQTAATQLNLTSSRSHSVFTIKLVSYGEPDLKNAASICASQHQQQQFTVNQLSVVDLAGVERSKRSKVTGAALAETSNINNSLLTLRNCFQAMRQNQHQQTQSSSRSAAAATAAVVPYRNHKLTYLLKSFFEGGQSSISMIICLNVMADFEENVQVLAFCSKAQEVLIVKQQRKQQHEQEDFEVYEEGTESNFRDDHLSSIVERFTWTRLQCSQEIQELTHSSHFAAFIKQTEQYLSAHANEASQLINIWHQSLQQLSERLKHYPPERQAHRQSLCLTEGAFYPLKTSARIAAQLMPSIDSTKGCPKASCQLYRMTQQLLPKLDSIAGTPIIFPRRRGHGHSTALPGAGDADDADSKLKDSQLLYQTNCRLLKELARDLSSWQAASVDAAMKLQGARAELGLYLNRGGKSGAAAGGSVKKKMDVFNRLYLQTPARYKVSTGAAAVNSAVSNGKVAQLRAFFTPPSSVQRKTTVAGRCGNSTPRRPRLPAASTTNVQSMCRQFNELGNSVEPN